MTSPWAPVHPLPVVAQVGATVIVNTPHARNIRIPTTRGLPAPTHATPLLPLPGQASPGKKRKIMGLTQDQGCILLKKERMKQMMG